MGELSGGGETGQCLSETLVSDVEGGAKRGACEAVVAGLLEGVEDGSVEVGRLGLLQLLLVADDAEVHVLFVSEEGEGAGEGLGAAQCSTDSWRVCCRRRRESAVSAQAKKSPEPRRLTPPVAEPFLRAW